MVVRVDSQYRSHRSIVQPCAVRFSAVPASHASRARAAAVLEPKPPRRARSGRPSMFGAEQWKYQEPCPRSAASRGQCSYSRRPLASRHPHC